MTSRAHVDFTAWVLGILDDAEAAQVEEHLATCIRCQREMDELTAMSGLLSEVGQHPPITRPRPDRWRWLRLAWRPVPPAAARDPWAQVERELDAVYSQLGAPADTIDGRDDD